MQKLIEFASSFIQNSRSSKETKSLTFWRVMWIFSRVEEIILSATAALGETILFDGNIDQNRQSKSMDLKDRLRQMTGLIDHYCNAISEECEYFQKFISQSPRPLIKFDDNMNMELIHIKITVQRLHYNKSQTNKRVGRNNKSIEDLIQVGWNAIETMLQTNRTDSPYALIDSNYRTMLLDSYRFWVLQKSLSLYRQIGCPLHFKGLLTDVSLSLLVEIDIGFRAESGNGDHEAELLFGVGLALKELKVDEIALLQLDSKHRALHREFIEFVCIQCLLDWLCRVATVLKIQIDNQTSASHEVRIPIVGPIPTGIFEDFDLSSGIDGPGLGVGTGACGRSGVCAVDKFDTINGLPASQAHQNRQGNPHFVIHLSQIYKNQWQIHQ